jgi:pimeloyl-ACP methyl ester carboxylesterase
VRVSASPTDEFRAAPPSLEGRSKHEAALETATGRFGMGSGERMVEANGVGLCVETFGDDRDPPLLLIMGAAASMLLWEDELCERLAAGGRFVIRYDHRDTGRSVTYAPGSPEYTGPDLAADAVGVLDALGVSSAHLVGMSMGGGIAQRVALDEPARVSSLTLISTSPGGADLPDISDELRAYFDAPPPPPEWSDRSAVIDYLVEDERAYAARSRPFDEAARRELAGRNFDRSIDLAATMTNHFLLAGDGGWRERLGEIRVPTLVLHGTEDPLFPIGHGRALATEIPGARLIALERTGHELPRETWEVVVPAILKHTSSADSWRR